MQSIAFDNSISTVNQIIRSDHAASASAQFKRLLSGVGAEPRDPDAINELRDDDAINELRDDDTINELREQAEQFVGFAFYLPLLQQARNSTFKSDLLHGGFAEDAFGAQLDQVLADRMATRDQTGLVDAIIELYSKNTSATQSRTPEMDRHG